MNEKLFCKIFILLRKLQSYHLSIFDQKGAALVTSILFATVIGVGALVATQNMFQDIDRGERYTQTREAFYIAEAGIQTAMNYLNYDENGDSPGDAGVGFTEVLTNFEFDRSEALSDVEFGGGTFTVTVRDNDDNDNDKNTDADNTIILSSTGIKDGRNITIEAVIQNGVYRNKHAITSGGNFTIEGDPTVQGNLGSIHSNSDVVGISTNVEQGIFAVGECDQGCESGAISEEIPLANPGDFSSYANFILTTNGDITDTAGEDIDIAEHQLENWSFSNAGWELEGCSGHGMFYSETDVSLAGDTGECGEKIVEEVEPEIAGARECAELAFHNQDDEKGTLINGEYLKGYISNWFPRAGFAFTAKKRRGLGRLQRGQSNDIYDFWRNCREWRVNGRITKKWKHSYDRVNRINDVASRRKYQPRSTTYVVYTPADLASASYFNFYVRRLVSQACIGMQINRCNYIKKYVDGVTQDNPPRPKYWQEIFSKGGCEELLKQSCSIEPKGIWNTPGQNCGGGDCSERFDIKPACEGVRGYFAPGCKGFRSTKEEMFYQCMRRSHQRNEKNWRNLIAARYKLENLTTRVIKKGRIPSQWPRVPRPVQENTLCERLALDDPKVLALIEEEEKYQEEFQPEANEQENDSESDGSYTRSLSGKPLSITLVAEGDILVSGDANIQNFKNENHPEEVQNLLFVAAGDLDMDGKVPEPIDGIVIADEQVSLTADAELIGYVIASDVYEESSMVTESNILENFTVTYSDLKNPFLSDQIKILSWKQ